MNAIANHPATANAACEARSDAARAALEALEQAFAYYSPAPSVDVAKPAAQLAPLAA